MHIGIDFDNTIVSYDALFHKVAVEQSAVPADLPPTKLAVRDYLRKIGEEDVWTEMQGFVYGTRMDEAAEYPGVLNFLAWARDKSIAVSIISHKTRYPFIGPQYDLHQAARAWVRTHLIDGRCSLVQPDRIFFELTKEDKLRRVAHSACDWFIDDLPEILLAEAFPPITARILFDPDDHHAEDCSLVRMANWSEILCHLQQQCLTSR